MTCYLFCSVFLLLDPRKCSLKFFLCSPFLILFCFYILLPLLFIYFHMSSLFNFFSFFSSCSLFSFCFFSNNTLNSLLFSQYFSFVSLPIFPISYTVCGEFTTSGNSYMNEQQKKTKNSCTKQL